MPCFIAYYRVSTQKQGKSGLGLEAQRKAVESYVAGKGNIAREYTEVESGRKSDRAELQKALKDAKRNGCTLIIAKLDRLSRNAAFLNQILDSGVEVCAVDMPTANRMVMSIMAAVAQHEVETISERIKVALQATKERGTLLGSRNPEWIAKHRDNVTAALPAAAVIGRAVRTAKADAFAEDMRETLQAAKASGLSLRKIAAQLNEQALFRPVRGTSWHASQVKNLCDRLAIS